jgi:hypothetical protein
MEVCVGSNSCVLNRDIHTICKLYNLDSYNKLNKLFEQTCAAIIYIIKQLKEIRP